MLEVGVPVAIALFTGLGAITSRLHGRIHEIDNAKILIYILLYVFLCLGYSFERLFPDVLFPAESTEHNRNNK